MISGRTITIALISIFLFSLFPSTWTYQNASIPMLTSNFESSETGQFDIYDKGTIETIRVEEYNTINDALEAVNSGTADLFGQRVNSSHYSLVESYANIEQLWAYDSLSCILTLNTMVYPLNNYHLRRAVAYAIDKIEISEIAMENRVDVIDLAIPLFNQYTNEAIDGGEFYQGNNSMAKFELGKAGMIDVDSDGAVEGPNGSEVVFDIWYPYDIPGMNETAEEISQNLNDAGINNTLVMLNCSTLQFEISNHNESYHLALYHQEISEYGYDWVAKTFHSDMKSVIGENPANLELSLLDDFSKDYERATTLEKAEAAGYNALITVRDYCPVIPLFSYRWLSVYNDVNLEGWIQDKYAGAFGLWNPIELVSRDGADNELVVAVTPEYFDNFYTSLNPFKSEMEIDDDWIHGSYFNPYLLVYDSPFINAPDGTAKPRHATSWDIEVLGIVSDLGSGQSRTKFYCDPNANWTDDEVMNAEDYRFTFEYYSNNSLTKWHELISTTKIIGTQIAGVTVNSRYVMTYRTIGVLPILPSHIWSEKDPYNWEPTTDEAIGSGPYSISAYSPGISLTLTLNDNYYPTPDDEAPVLGSLSIIPEEPIPAETVVIRVYVNDRSKLDNVTLHYSQNVGNINFTDYQVMLEDAEGFQGTIPARVTADSVSWYITASDIWGNSAIIAEGTYDRESSESDASFESVLLFLEIGGVVIVAVAIIFFIMKKRKTYSL